MTLPVVRHLRTPFAVLSAAFFSVTLASVSRAQTPVADSSRPAALTAAPRSAAGADTAVQWAELSSRQGELRGKLPQLLKARLDSARAQGRTMYVEVGATWCGPCLQLEASLKQPEMIDAFAGTSIVHLDANEWDVEEDMAPIGINGGTMPLIIALDTNGKVVEQINGVIDAPSLKKFFTTHRWSSVANADASAAAKAAKH